MSEDRTLKTIPAFNTDEEAERFVDEANLADYDLSGFKPMHFEFEKNPPRSTCESPTHCSKR